MRSIGVEQISTGTASNIAVFNTDDGGMTGEDIIYAVHHGGNRSFTADDDGRTTEHTLHSVGTASSDLEVRNCIPNFALESIKLHRDVANALTTISTCNHGNRRVQEWSCSRCTKALENYYNEFSLQSAVLGRYIRDVLRCGERNPPFTRMTSACINAVMVRKIADFEKYLAELSKKIHPSALSYWRKFGSAQPDEAEVNMDAKLKMKSLFIFPGRKQCRDPIDFDGVDKQECTKVYVKGKIAVPTFLTVQCCCSHPKLIGFVLNANLSLQCYPVY